MIDQKQMIRRNPWSAAPIVAALLAGGIAPVYAQTVSTGTTPPVSAAGTGAAAGAADTSTTPTPTHAQIETSGDLAAPSTTALSEKDLPLAREIIRYALATFDRQVVAFNADVKQVDTDDAAYRKDYNTNLAATQQIQALVNGNHSSNLTYPQLIALRDQSATSAAADLTKLRQDAIDAQTALQALQQNSLFNYAYENSQNAAANGDLRDFTARLNWGPGVATNLAYVVRKPSTLGGDTPTTGNTSTSQDTQQALTMAGQLRDGVYRNFSSLVNEYNTLARRADTDAAEYKRDQQSYQSMQRSQPARNSSYVVNSGRNRGRRVSRTNPAWDSWNNRRQSTLNAANAAQADEQASTQRAEAILAFLQQYPQLMKATGFKMPTTTATSNRSGRNK